MAEATNMISSDNELEKKSGNNMTGSLNSFLFASADPHIDGLGKDDFDFKLAIGILFHPHLKMHHGYYLNSERLIAHLRRSPDQKSLFEAACEAAVILPVFGSEVMDFEGLNAGAKRRWGPSFKVNESLEGDYFLWNRLKLSINNGINKALNDGANLICKNRLERSGEGYLQKIRKALQYDNDYINNLPADSELKKIWEYTSRFRFDAVDQAAELSTKITGQDSLGRLQLYQQVANIVSTGKNSIYDPKFRDISKYVSDPWERNALKRFLKWATQIHQINYGDYADSETSLGSAFDKLDIVDKIFLGRDVLPNRIENERVTVLISLPSVGDLTRQNPQDLFALRENEGMVFFDALNRWMTRQTDDHDMLRLSLQKYAGAICKRYGQKSRVTVAAEQLVNPSNPIVKTLGGLLRQLAGFLPGGSAVYWTAYVTGGIYLHFNKDEPQGAKNETLNFSRRAGTI